MSATCCSLHSWISMVKTAIIESTTPISTTSSLGNYSQGRTLTHALATRVRAVRHLTKERSKYASKPVDFMIDDDTTTFCEALHSPSNLPNAYRKCYFDWVFNGSFPVSHFDRGGTWACHAPAAWPHPCDVNGNSGFPSLNVEGSSSQPWPIAESVSTAATCLLLSCLRSWSSCHPSPVCRCLP